MGNIEKDETAVDQPEFVEYDKDSFWTKISNYAFAAGRECIEKVLILYYCAIDEDTPTTAKMAI